MPRIQPLASLLRPLAAPRTATCTHHYRFSTASRLCAEKPAKSAKPSVPSQAPPAPPTTPQEASRAADLAAAEAITESDSAQPPEPKPDLPSERADISSQPTNAGDVFPPAPSTSQPNTNSRPKKMFDTTLPRKTGPAVSQLTAAGKKLPLASHKASTPTPTSMSIDLPPPKYHVSRSKNGNYPIYTDYKRGGNLHQTTVRKITGDLSQLRDELRVWLNKKNEDVKINSLTQQIVVKGHVKEEVLRFLGGRGF